MRERKTEKKVYDYLEHLITNEILLPQTKIVEEDIAKILGVSRSPVRAALKKLEQNKIVYIEPYKGAIVQGKSITKKEFVDKLQVFELLFIQYFFQVETGKYSLPLEKIEQKIETIKTMISEAASFNQIMLEEVELLALFFEGQQNQYYKNLLINILRQVLTANLKELPKDPLFVAQLFIQHFEKMRQYGENENYPFIRREIRIFVNRLVLEVIDQQEIGKIDKYGEQ